MSKEISLNNLNSLCLGAAFLGSGGGGDVNYLKPIVHNAILDNGNIPVVDLEDLDENGYILGVEFIGAPLPKDKRKFITGTPNVNALLEFTRQDLQKSIQALIPVEIGGANCLTPMCAANQAKIPLLDGDLLGRALPEIQMVSTNLFGMIPEKVYISDPYGKNLEILYCDSYQAIETQARERAINYGTYTAIMVSAILSAEQAKQVLIPGTISQAISIGKQNTIEDLQKAVNGKAISKGTVTDINYDLEKGFLNGNITIESENSIFNIFVKNEYLHLRKNNELIAQCPDIITLLNAESLKPMQSDQIKISDEIIIFTCPGPNIWYTQKGLQLTKMAF